jgi:hypothetical protein
MLAQCKVEQLPWALTACDGTQALLVACYMVGVYVESVSRCS